MIKHKFNVHRNKLQCHANEIVQMVQMQETFSTTTITDLNLTEDIYFIIFLILIVLFIRFIRGIFCDVSSNNIKHSFSILGKPYISYCDEANRMTLNNIKLN